MRLQYKLLHCEHGITLQTDPGFQRALKAHSWIIAMRLFTHALRLFYIVNVLISSLIYTSRCLSSPVGTHMIRRNQAPKFPGPAKPFVVWNNKFPGSFNHLCFIVRKVNVGNFIVMLFSFVELQRSTDSFDQNSPGYYRSFNQSVREQQQNVPTTVTVYELA